ncbi:SDR family oxidoreductase [Bacillus cereus]|uniref:SDR family NAD(P)-dependent oxidoreductase n=1 Tax=Bacillus cereus group TaxID=86661 RepID=UPI000BF4C3F0|nr:MULTISPECIES: SDR family oxidoreductase [Bacillus cereus group]PFE48298.1 SDR family oxidoreductase [Bacillus cereus]PFE67592.1 SDR family oxidoreductase [Bacillus cereus]PFI97841.1 SDR family oxidoreductase [Bacillus cereus]PFL13740.1 SDR family oxidoreductase [Bacillus cereus]PGL42086.1 SDR family oxidoreductase [Bacillus cereus]
MDLKLSGKKALIVGGSRGIGKATARQLALEGVDCTICSRNESSLKIAAEELAQETNRNIYPIVADTTDPDSILNLVEKSAAAMGGIDILVNSGARVGGFEPEDFNSIKDELILKDFEEKYMGYFRCIRAVAPYMIENNWGRIISISGLAARIGGNYFSSGPRNASVVHLTKSASLELGKHGINVNAVYPGIVDTEMFRNRVTNEEALRQMAALNAIGRLITVEEIANVITFLASPLAASITGDVISVTGGIGDTVFY